MLSSGVKKTNEKIDEETIKLGVKFGFGDEDTVKVLLDPSEKSLIAFCNTSKVKSLRGLAFENNEVYFWDAYDASHTNIQKALGIHLKNIRIVFKKSKKSSEYLLGAIDSDDLINIDDNRAIQKLLKSGKIKSFNPI